MIVTRPNALKATKGKMLLCSIKLCPSLNGSTEMGLAGLHHRLQRARLPKKHETPVSISSSSFCSASGSAANWCCCGAAGSTLSFLRGGAAMQLLAFLSFFLFLGRLLDILQSFSFRLFQPAGCRTHRFLLPGSSQLSIFAIKEPGKRPELLQVLGGLDALGRLGAQKPASRHAQSWRWYRAGAHRRCALAAAAGLRNLAVPPNRRPCFAVRLET